jgi:ATP-dependent DNA helicase RecQ
MPRSLQETTKRCDLAVAAAAVLGYAWPFERPMTPDQVTEKVQELERAWAGGSPADPALRARCGDALEGLRALYRTQPAAFGTDEVSMLRSVADALRRPPTLARPDSLAKELKAVFGYDTFRPGQEAIIDAVLGGRDCVGVMPTGAGKSLTYQLPARLLGGTTLVVSPLVALMKDQVDALTELGFKATFLNSTIDFDERSRRIDALAKGEYELVYAAPEGLEAGTGAALRRVKLSLIAVDEAHCISQWGHDFRPAYRNLSALRRKFGQAPILALTATATPEVMKDIVTQLGMQKPAQYRGSFFRPNLNLFAYKKGGDSGLNVRESILRLVRARRNESGIVYCLSRKSVEGIAEFLAQNGVSALAYHAGMTPEARNLAQDAFRRDDVDVMVATVAFGMGIDKSNIRYVIHRDMPRSIEGYYQEIGRAGRDGVSSDCILFYSFADVMSYDRFADTTTDEAGDRQRRQVREMFELADRVDCRHQLLVGYLGEQIGPCKSSCDVCSGKSLLDEAPRVAVKKARPKDRGTATPSQPAVRPRFDSEDMGEGTLFDKLRKLRKTLADSRNVPAYVVFSDATLLEMSKKKPRSESELLEISGVGPKKVAAYGEVFLRLLRDG